MFNKWSKLKSYLTNNIFPSGAPTGGGGTGNPLFDVFIAVGRAVFNFLSRPAVQLTLFVASGVYSHIKTQELKKTGQEILLTKFGTGDGMPVIYGTRRVAGTVVYMGTSEFQKELFVVYAIAGHEIDSFDLETIQIDGNPISNVQIYRDGFVASDGTTRITSSGGRGTKASGNFFGSTSTEISNILAGTNPPDRPRMVFNCHTGSTTQAADPMLVGCLQNFTTDHKLTNIAYIACNFEYDIRGQFTGLPNVTVVVNGKKLYDPRADGSISGGTGSHRSNDVSTHAFSANPALCLLDYMTNDDYGKGLDPTETTGDIDLGSFQTAATACDVSADTITHSSIVVEQASTSTDIVRIANANEADYNKFKVASTFTVSDGVTTYINNKRLIDKDYRVLDDSGSAGVPFLELKFEDGAVDTAITTNTTCTFTETQVKFDCHGVIDTQESVLENTKALVANMRGIFTYSNGQYAIRVEGAESSVLTLDEDDIFDSGLNLALENKEAKYNKVEAEFYNAQKRYETDTTYYTGETSDNFLSEDGNEILETRIQLPFCTNQRIAYNHAKALLKRSRSQKTVSFVATPKVLKAKVGEVITITSSNMGLSSQLFRITNMVINPDLNIEVTAIEYQSDIYGYVTPPDESIGIIDDPVDGQRVEPVTGLTFTNKNSTTGEPAKLTWTDSTKYPSYEFRVQIVDSGGKTRYDRRVQETTFYLDGISIDTGYTAKVSAINTLGIESATTEITVNVTTAPITTVDIGQGSIGGFSFDATKMYHGTGTFNNTNTAVYFDNTGQFSLKDKLSWNGTTLNISGNLTVENTITADKIILDGQTLNTLMSSTGSGATTIGELTVSNDTFLEGGFEITAGQDGVFLDNAKAKFGTGSDLQIYHDGSDSYILDNGTGSLKIDGSEQQFLIGGSEKMRLSSSGSLGIGTASPSGGAVGGKVLHLVNSGGTASVRVDRSDSSTSGTISLLDANNTHGLYGTGSKPMAFSTNSTERMRISDTGRLGVGTTSPDSKIHSYQTAANYAAHFESANANSYGIWVEAGASANDGYPLISVTDNGGSNQYFRVDSGTGRVAVGTTSPVAPFVVSNGGAAGMEFHPELTTDTNRLTNYDRTASAYMNFKLDALTQQFNISGSEKMRLDSSGRLLVGKTAVGTNTVGVECRGDGLLAATRSGAVVAVINRKSSDGAAMQFRKDNVTVGSVSVTGSATTYNTSSDARLKDITGSARGLELINQLNPVAYNWKADGKADEGLIAQELEELLPNAVSQNEDGYYQMDYSKLVTILIKGIQEQQKQIEQLKKQAHPCKELHEFEAYPELINKIESLQEQINKL